MSDKLQKEFLHVDVEPDTIGQNLLASLHNEGWESYAPAQWDSVSRVWRVLLYRDMEVPAPVATPPPTPTLIAETIPMVKVAPEPIPMGGKQGLWTWEYEMPKPKPKAFLDTETTGLDENARICEIAIVDEHGEILLNTVVNPQIPIPSEASAIHSITDAVVAHAPTFDSLREQILGIFAQYDVYIYNADYDTRLLTQSGEDMPKLKATCVMKPFSRIYGQWNDYHQSYTFQSLAKACEYYDIQNPHPHRALGDALTARLVWLAMTKKAVTA